MGDKKRRAFIEAKNNADALIHQVDKALAEPGATLQGADRSEAEAALLAVHAAIEGGDHDQLKQATDRLSLVANKIAEAAQKPQPGAPAGGKPAGTSGEPVDAEFEEVGH